MISFKSFKTGVSNPAESNNAILLFIYSSNSGYFMLRPSVDMLVPEGKSILEILDNKNDLPLSAFPITPIFKTGSSLFSKYCFLPLSFDFITHPLLISLIDFISIIIS